MKHWRSFLRESISLKYVIYQLKPGSYLWKLFIFSLVAAISSGIIYSFVSQFLGGTRAATETVTVTAGVSKNQLSINEEFSVNVLLAGANEKKISQLDLRIDVPVSPETGDVAYATGKIESMAVGKIENYFDTVVLEQADEATGQQKKIRIVLSSRKPEAELSDRVIVKVGFKATTNGVVNFTLDTANMEIVGPGGGNTPTTFTVGLGSNVNTRVTIGNGPTATTVPATQAPASPTLALPTSSEPSKVPSGERCESTSQCQNGYACMSGKCLPLLCDGQRTCPDRYSCKQGVCFPGVCDLNNPCVNGYNCSNGMCLPSQCRADQPCPPGYACNDDGTCTKDDGIGKCTDDSACKASGQCISGSCFCKEGSYNCNRDWADGCETTTPCEGSGTAKVVIRAKFNGVGVNVPPTVEGIKVKVMLSNKYLKAPIEREVTLTEFGKGDRNISLYQGSFEVNNIPFGSDYSVFVKGEKHLQKRICDQSPSEVVDGRYFCTKGSIRIKEGENILDFTKIYQLGGDVPVSNAQDGFIDAVDVVFIRSNFGSKDAGKLTIADINKDGIIDTQDYSLALYALSFKYDEEITSNN